MFKDFFAAWVKHSMLVFLLFMFSFCGIIVGYETGMDTVMIIGIILTVVIIVAYIIGKTQISKIKNNIIIENGCTISVAERTSDNKRMFSILRHFEQGFEYHPATATFTAVSVGGVTTGGWSVEDAHYTASSGARTDKCLLQFSPMDDRKGVEPIIVTYIRLSKDDIQIAKNNSFLRQFLSVKNRVLTLAHPVVKSNATAARQHFQSTGDVYGSMNFLTGDYTQSLLTRKELEQVVDFLCGK